MNGASIQSVSEVIANIETFISSYNERAMPFIWTKSEVYQKSPQAVFRGRVILGFSAETRQCTFV